MKHTAIKKIGPKGFPLLKTARALVETMMPAGAVVPEGDVDAIIQDVAGYFVQARWLRVVQRFLLAWLWIRTFVVTGRSFAALAVPKRNKLLARWEQRMISGWMVKLVSAPYKVSYIFDEDNRSKLGWPKTVPPVVTEKPRWLGQVQDASDLSGSETLEADVVVIGTGAGGAAAAWELASQGLAVVILEEGAYHQRDYFDGDIVKLMRTLYRSWGTTATIGNTVIPVPIGRSVGGTTTINSGSCLRTPHWVLEEWADEGINGLTPTDLAPYFEKVEEILEVQPGEKQYVGPIGDVVKKGANALGYHECHIITRNAAGCDGQALCQFGCPTDAKKSTNVSFIPKALQYGAFLYTGMKAEKVLWRHNAVDGLVAHGKDKGGQPVRLKIKARAVVVSAGTLLTPQFLHRNGIRNRNLGRNLSIHPAAGVQARFPDIDFRNRGTIPQGYAVSDLRQEDIMFEGATLPPIAHGLMGPSHGGDQGFVHHIEQYDHTAYFGFMLRENSRGKVYSRSLFGRPLMTYWLNRQDWKSMLRAEDLLARMMFRAGATEVWLNARPGIPSVKSEDELEKVLRKRRPSDFTITAYHPLGTARIAATAAKGVCAEDHSVFGVQGLYVMDGSAVPSPLGVNPQVTIMSLAMKAARALGQKLNAEAL